ncbi:hypothetical protein HRI_000199000 [Hibiscus trionum]|uniref:RNase H type-1 domain-containing protein n=1 Tax=Hibiscus trionum TaxID=183268 RepID=A0A9W7LIA0_HIBTR|nr:hypothetical protein HRI_000199000 [Hibiscus trionum]
MFHGLEFALDLGLRCVIIEGDNKSISQKLNSHSIDLSEIGPIIRDIKQFQRNFTSCEVSFIGRNGNRPAHALASEGLRCFADRSWVEEAPNFVRSLTDQDCRFCDPP